MNLARQRSLWSAFEEGDKKKLAQGLVDLARAGFKNPATVFSDHPLYDDFMDFATASIQEFIQNRRGIIYVVHNPINRNFYKIGLTGAATLEKRLRSLNSAGVVGEIHEVERAYALDRFGAEGQAHKQMGKHTVQHKEYFVCDDYKLVSSVMQDAVKEDNTILCRSFPELNVFLQPQHQESPETSP